MAATLFPAIQLYRKGSQERLHEATEVGFNRPDIKVKMVRHKAITQYIHIESLGKHRQLLNKQGVIRV
ncbi:MAG: hypothetical protein WCV92_05300 [Candidatus Buchananbacteria bacterium]